MDINMQYEDFPSLGLEFPIVVSVEDTSMFTQVSDQEVEKLSGQDAERETGEGTETQSQDSAANQSDAIDENKIDDVDKDNTHGFEQRNTHGVRISFGSPPPSKNFISKGAQPQGVNSGHGKPKLKKLDIKKGPTYSTRSKTTFKSVFLGMMQTQLTLASV
ncbi:unnamed protein product [Cuscuta europaea]|uniref:Uncharacterized protein n=1 Tax=Cuscuta europaea TaxID=41803 RepID=A0A9P0YV91_CUSEU|nr:unnamed protein product [Cuscuta europaea]